MRFFAHHGYYEEEQILGNEFILDVAVERSTKLASETDELYATSYLGGEEDVKPTTVNYETIYLLCQIEMRKPVKLLETLVERIADRLVDHFGSLTGLLVRVRKSHPPLGGRVDAALVMTKRGKIDSACLVG